VVPSDKQPLADWAWMHTELRRPGVNLTAALAGVPAQTAGLQYSRFCEHYRAWAGKLDLVMCQEHSVGEKLFVDYAG